MKEASRVKFYLAKYFFLALSTLQGLAAVLMTIQFEDTVKNRSVVFVFATFCMIFFSLHLLISEKIKRVAISKKKISIILRDKIKSYNWSEVKEVKYLPFLNIYSFKLKGKANRIYFLPNEQSGALFGFLSTNADFIPKKISKA